MARFLLFSIIFVCLQCNYKEEADITKIYVEGYNVFTNEYIEITVSGSIIEAIQPKIPPSDIKEKVYISPGFIDTQINGYAAVSFNEYDLNNEKVSLITRALWSEGVTTFFPTLITNDPQVVMDNIEVLESAREELKIAHSIPGYFLEGPYISYEDGFRGAHMAEWVREPDWSEFEKFIERSNNHIIQVGLSPEFSGSMDFISACVKEGIVVSLAHHNGTYEQINQAAVLGARVSTHLGNGCANYIHRHNNPLWPQLANELLTPSIIADGHHLRKEELQVFYKVKGAGNMMLVSDATKLAGMPAGIYDWNGKEVVMTADGMLKYPEQNVLAGASFPIKRGIETMVNYEICPLSDAVRMATTTPAGLYGLTSAGNLGKDLDADITTFTFDKGNIEIQQTILKGETVYKR